METTQKPPEQPTKHRVFPPLSQMWIGGSGLISFVLDSFKFGDNRYENVPSNGTFALAMVITLIVGYYAWKASSSSYRDAVIVVFAIAAYAEVLQSTTDANKVGVLDLVFDLIWIGVAYVLYRRPSKSE